MYKSYSQIREALFKGETTYTQIVKNYLEVIDDKKHLNAFLEVFADEALTRARTIDEKIKNGTAGKLAGMVVAIKDVIAYKGHKFSASSKILEGFESVFSSTAIERLLNEDAIIIGRTNCDEFAMGSSNENSAFGVVKNPLDETRVPGGSSGGSAAAVKAGMCTAALGTDTGGSIRQPASFCGIVGLKPTYGRVSRWGLIAYASSFDQIGPITNTVEDAALMLEVIAGKDEYDATASSEKTDTYSKIILEESINKKYKIAVLKDAVESEGLDERIRKYFSRLEKKLQKAGHTVEKVDFPYLNYEVPAYYVLTTAEASSNLARYDGARYGYRSRNISNVEEMYVKSRSEGFGKEVKRRIMLGTFVLSAGYYDAYYTKGQKVRRLIQSATTEILNKYDFILMPTTPTTAFKIGEKSEDPIQMYLADIFTVHANLSGHPAISLPLAVHENGLPFGVQLMSSYFCEATLLTFSSCLMKHFSSASV